MERGKGGEREGGREEEGMSKGGRWKVREGGSEGGKDGGRDGWKERGEGRR